MTPDERQIILDLGISLSINFYQYIVIIVLYGIFCPLGILAIRYSIQNSSQRVAPCIMLFGILTATGLLITQCASLVSLLSLGLVENIGTPIAEKRQSTNQKLQPWDDANTGFQLFPLLANDALIIWRAWILFSKMRWTLYVLVMLWLMTAGTVLSTIILFSKPYYVYLQYTSFGLTFGTNLIATCCIGFILWRHRKAFKGLSLIPGKSRSWKLLTLLFEMGFVYCLLQLVSLISVILTQPYTTPAAELTLFQLIMYMFYNVFIMLSMLYPVIGAMVTQGPSIMLSIHKTASSAADPSTKTEPDSLLTPVPCELPVAIS